MITSYLLSTWTTEWFVEIHRLGILIFTLFERQIENHKNGRNPRERVNHKQCI